MDWQPITTAPVDGTPIVLKCESRPDFGSHVMAWSQRRKRWEGEAFAMVRVVPTWWDEAAEQPFVAFAVLSLLAALLIAMVALVTRFLRGSWNP